MGHIKAFESRIDAPHGELSGASRTILPPISAYLVDFQLYRPGVTLAVLAGRMSDVTVSKVLPGRRVQFIDAARGGAMFFVLLSHFGFTFFPNQFDLAPTIMRLVGMVASPTFIIINGLLFGFLYRTRVNNQDRFRAILVDRGLFLLTVGHLVILGSHVSSYTVRFLSITDTVGVCMIAGTWLVVRLDRRNRLLLSLALFGVSWLAIDNWQPHAILAVAIKETLFGSLTPTIYYYAFPLLPWFSLDLAASALGDCLGVHYENNDTATMRRVLLTTAASALTAAAALNAAAHMVRHYGFAMAATAHVLASPFQKEPPSPVYFLFYGALGLFLIAAFMRLADGEYAPRLMTAAASLGKTSFAVFVAQFYVYFTVLPFVRHHLPWSMPWGVWLPLSVLVILLPALEWQRRGFNRFLTVGYLRSWRLRSRRESPPALGMLERLSHTT